MTYPIIAKFINQKNQTEVINKYTEKIQEMNDIDINEQKQKYQEYNNKLMENKKELLKTGEVIGYIKIEKIKIYLPIYEGTDDDILSKGVGHLENTGIPTKKGDYHAIFVGHTGLSSKTIFDNLIKLKMGDEFKITILDETFKYKIYSIKKVLPNETENLEIQKGKQYVTLVTCTPKFINSHRLLILGEKMA